MGEIKVGSVTPTVPLLHAHWTTVVLFSNVKRCVVVLQELSWRAGYDDADERKRPLISVAGEAILLALHRPLAV